MTASCSILAIVKKISRQDAKTQRVKNSRTFEQPNSPSVDESMEGERTTKLETMGAIQNSGRDAALSDLKQRLVLYAARVLRLVKALPRTPEGLHIASQIARSGTSPAPNYAESQDAESGADFVHKLKIVLKELRETEVWLLIIVESDILKKTAVQPLIDETNELIAIFVASVKTARKSRR